MTEKRDHYIFIRRYTTSPPNASRINHNGSIPPVPSIFYAISEASRRPKETPSEGAFPLNFPIAAGCEKGLLPSHSPSLTLCLKGEIFGPFYFSPISFFGAVWPFKPIAFLSSMSLPGHAGFHQRLSFSSRRRVDESKSD